jgi:hypothetical protein
MVAAAAWRLDKGGPVGSGKGGGDAHPGSPEQHGAIAHLAETPFGFLPTTSLPRHTQ